MCSNCPPLDDTQKWRRLRRSSMASSITNCCIADRASTNRRFSSTKFYIGDLCTRSGMHASSPRSYNRLGSDLDCWGHRSEPMNLGICWASKTTVSRTRCAGAPSCWNYLSARQCTTYHTVNLLFNMKIRPAYTSSPVWKYDRLRRLR
jgi:hypothetical protein